MIFLEFIERVAKEATIFRCNGNMELKLLLAAHIICAACTRDN